MKNLYRITSLEGFLSLIVNKQERLVRPIDCWEDTFEGYMLHLLDSNEGMLDVIERLYSDISNSNATITIRNFSKLQRSRYTCYGICWSKLKDSDAMWRIYSYDNKGIQLVSNIDSINRLIIDNGWNKSDYDIYDVKYDINDEEAALKKILVRNAKIDTAYFHKRPAFEHEQEVRVIINDSEQYKNIEAFSSQAILLNLKKTDENKPITQRIQEAIIQFGGRENYRKVAPKYITLNIRDFSSYLDGIRVHPLASDWYCDLIKRIALMNGINYLGKSDLYKQVL